VHLHNSFSGKSFILVPDEITEIGAWSMLASCVNVLVEMEVNIVGIVIIINKV